MAKYFATRDTESGERAACHQHSLTDMHHFNQLGRGLESRSTICRASCRPVPEFIATGDVSLRQRRGHR